VSGIRQESYDAALEAVSPYIPRTLGRAPSGGRFTTQQFIRALRQDPQAEAAYQRALQILAENPGWAHAAAKVLHGQVIPQLLRACPNVRFAGFAYDAPPAEDDGTAVPTYWRKG
jgi:hypothetical protein